VLWTIAFVLIGAAAAIAWFTPQSYVP
jgi:hypothetical protein